MKTRGREQAAQRGFALAAALLGTILIAAILASLFFAVTQETRTGLAVGQRDRALAAAESALETGLERLPAMPDHFIGTAASHLVEIEGLSAVVHITRLDSAVFWLVAVVGDGRDPSSATRRIGVLAEAWRAASDSITIVRIPERAWSELF